jgi:hypothetical protein
MARIFIDGLEAGNLDLWSTSNSCYAISSAGYDMSGNYICDLHYLTSWVQKVLSSTYTALYVAFKYRYMSSATANTTSIILFKDSNNTFTACVTKSSSGVLQIRVGKADGTILATGSTVMYVDTVYLIEVYYKPRNSGGELTVKLNGTSQATYSGDTTAGIENINIIQFGWDLASSAYSYCYMDDVVIDDANWIGNSKIQAVTVTGAGTTTQWDPSTGSNYDCVNEIPYSDSDYIYTNTVDYLDTYQMSNLTGNISNINCIQVQMRARYKGNPTPGHIKATVRTNSTDYVHGTELNPGITFNGLASIWENNPTDSQSWEEADINALEVGVKAIT